MNALISLCHFCDCHGPRTIMCTQAINKSEDMLVKEVILPSNKNENLTIVKDKCKSCQLLSDKENCLVSYDDDNEIYYITSDCPRNPSTFHLVRTACLRSLYSERTQGRGGALLFGHGNCMVGCCTFFLKDLQARGQTRYYSLQIILSDKFMLTSCWSYLVDQFTRIIDQLKECSFMVFDYESTTNSARYVGVPYLASSMLNRSLSELTALPDISYRLHSWFTWILRSLPQLITEEILEGQPTEDQLYELELFDDILDSNDNDDMLSDNENDYVETNSSCKDEKPASISDFSTKLSSTIVPDQKILEEENNKNMIRSLENVRILSRKLGISKFRLLVYHVIIGNQIVIRCDSKEVIRSLIQCLEILLPKKCCQSVYYSEVYVDTFRANFLGMPLLANNVKRQSIVGPADGRYLFLDVSVKHTRNKQIGALNYIVKIRAKILVPTTLPKLSQKLVNLITNNQIPTRAALSQLRMIKQDWLQKSKIFYASTRCNRSVTYNNYELYKSLEIESCDLSVLLFWQKGISYHNHKQILKMQVEHVQRQNQKHNQESSNNNSSDFSTSNKDLGTNENMALMHTDENAGSAIKVSNLSVSVDDKPAIVVTATAATNNNDDKACDKDIVTCGKSNISIKAASLLTLNEIQKEDEQCIHHISSMRHLVNNRQLSQDNRQQKQLTSTKTCHHSSINFTRAASPDIEDTPIALSNLVSVRNVPTLYNAVTRRSAAI